MIDAEDWLTSDEADDSDERSDEKVRAIFS